MGPRKIDRVIIRIALVVIALVVIGAAALLFAPVWGK